MSGAAREGEGKGGLMNRAFSGTARGVYAEMPACVRVREYVRIQHVFPCVCDNVKNDQVRGLHLPPVRRSLERAPRILSLK